MTDAELNYMHTFYYKMDEESRDSLKEFYVKDIIEMVSNPTWENLHIAKGSFIQLYILVSAEENKKNRK